MNLTPNLVYAQTLSEISPADLSWRKRKRVGIRIARILDGTIHEKRGKKILGCAPIIHFRLVEQEDGTSKPKLKNAHFCRDPFCPTCLAGVAKAKRRKVVEALPQLLRDNQGVRFLHLVLTTRNPKIHSLRKHFQWMHKSFISMMRDKRVNHLGYIRALEVTYGNSGNDECHPHFHVLVAVSPDYFDTNQSLYLSQQAWSSLWSEKLGVDYSANVSVSAVKRSHKLGVGTVLGEIIKYCTKSTDLLEDKNWTISYISQILGLKRMTTSGLFRRYMKELESDPKDLIGKDGKNETSETILQFRWCWEKQDYILDKIFEERITKEEFSTTKTPQY